MSTTIIIIVCAISLILFAAAFSSRFLIMLRYVAEVLNLGFIVDFIVQSSLDKIFYNYRHSNIKAWAHWVSKQSESVKTEAMDLLLSHLTGNPSYWGMISPQAVNSLAVFLRNDASNLKQLISILQNITKECKKYWLKYKITEQMLQACWETLINLDDEQALQLLREELKTVQPSETAIYISIVNAFKGLKKEVYISDIVSEMLTHSKLAFEVKKHCIDLMEEHREEQENRETIIKTFMKLMEYQTPMDHDDLGKVIHRLLNLVIDDLD